MTEAPLAKATPRIDHPAELDRVVRRIAERVDPVAIYLFGSRARGDADAESDYDLMVIIPDEQHRPDLKWVSEGRAVSIDAKVRSESWFVSRMYEVGTLEHEVGTEGIKLCSSRDFDCVCPPSPNPPMNREVVDELLRGCDHELAAADCAAREVPDQAAIHAEWAARWLARGALVAHRKRPPFRGTIARAVSLLPPSFLLRERFFTLHELSGHEAAFRYPLEDERLALPEPSGAQVESWIAEIEALKADFERWLEQKARGGDA